MALEVGDDLQREKDTHCFVCHFDFLQSFFTAAGNKQRVYASHIKKNIASHAHARWQPSFNCVGYIKTKASEFMPQFLLF